MDFVNTIITSSDADAFFGDDDLFGNLTLRATLRFIALKHHQGDIETIKPIKAQTMSFYESNTGNEYANYAKEHGIELLILTAPRGAQLLTINEDGWVSLDTPPYPVAPFLSSASETRVYSNATIKSTIIFVRQATGKWIDALCSSMFRILPWYFTDGISKDETALFKAINTKDSEAFVKIVNDTCAPYDFKAVRFKRMLIGWNDGYRKQQIIKLKNNAENTLKLISDHQERITNLLNALNEYNANLTSLQAQCDSSDDSVFRFFMNHHDISICNISLNTNNGNIMDYCIFDTLEFFDRDEFLRVYNNELSNIGCAPKDIRDILYAIFGLEENKGLFRVESMFRLANLSSLNVLRERRSHQYDYTHLPHPHLVNYGCLGGNSKYINQYMQQGNWDMAIEQSIAATKNINFGDIVVIDSFLRDIRNSMDSCKCIVANNGKEMTPREFLAYINENKENEDTENG